MTTVAVVVVVVLSDLLSVRVTQVYRGLFLLLCGWW